jgi:membrane carboxypeptidase/penicillin-binding protein
MAWHGGGAELFQQDAGGADLEEAAFLASLPQAPSNYHPVRAKERVTERRNFVLKEMFENGYITEAEMEARGPSRFCRCRTAIRAVPRRPAAARLLHRRDPPPAFGAISAKRISSAAA